MAVLSVLEALITCLYTMVVALLILSGSSKIFSPRALAEIGIKVLGILESRVAHKLARLIGVYELVLALVMVLAPGGSVAPAMLAILGLGILMFVPAARARATGVACGCFGSGSPRPIGRSNVVVGAAFVGTSILLVSAAPLDLRPSAASSESLLLAATIIALFAAMHMNRKGFMSVLAVAASRRPVGIGHA